MTEWLPYLPIVVAPFWIMLNLAINRHVSRRSRHHAFDLSIDARFPFLAIFALPYFSAYILGLMGYILMWRHPDLGRVLVGYVFLVAVGSICYLLFPSRVTRYENLIVAGPSTAMLAWFQRLSGPYNAFPSMHIAYCLYSALISWHYAGGPTGVCLTLWVLLVGVSTLFTKQHYLIDLLAGAVVGVVGYMTVIRLL